MSHTVHCVEEILRRRDRSLGLCWETAAISILDSSQLIAKEVVVAKNLSFPAAVLERQEAAIKKGTDELWSNIRAALAAKPAQVGRRGGHASSLASASRRPTCPRP